MKIGFQTIVWGPRYRNLRYMLDVIAAAGYQGVELFQRPTVLGNIEVLLKLLEKFKYKDEKGEEHELELIGLSGGSLKERMKFCGYFRPKYLYVDTWNEQEACEAMDAGFTLGLHPHAYMPVGNLATALKILENHPSDKYPRLKFVPDTAHLTVTHDDIVKAVRENIDRIVAVHLKDWSPDFGRSSYRYARGFAELGEGKVDLGAVLDELKRINYDGWVVVEQDYTITDPVTNTLESARWLAKRKLLSKHPKSPQEVKSLAGLQSPIRPRPSKKKEALFLRSIRPARLRDINLWYETIARTFRRLVPCKLVEVWTCSPAQDIMNLVAIGPDPDISLKTFIPRRQEVLSGDTMERKTVTHFDLTDPENAECFEHPELLSRFDIKKMISVPIFNPWNFNHVRLIVNLFPHDEKSLPHDDELSRFGEYVAFTLDSTLEDVCSSSAAKVSYQASRCKGVRDFLDSLVDLVRTTINCEGVAIFMVNDSGDKLELKATTGTTWNVAKNEQFYRRGEGLTGRVWEIKETVLSADASLEPGWKGKSFEGVGTHKEKPCVFVPLMKTIGEVTGVIRCLNKTAPRTLGKSKVFSFSDDDAAILESIAQAAIPHVERLLSQEQREKALTDMKTSLRVLGHEADQLNFGLDELRRRYLSNVRKLRQLDEQKADDICRDIEGYFKQLDFLFKQAEILVTELPQPVKKEFWAYREILFKWRDIYRLEARIKNLEFDICKTWANDPWRPPVYGDQMLLEQLVYNLVSNAVKYSYPGTKIAIDCKKAKLSKKSPHIMTVIDYGREFKCENPFELYTRGDNVKGIEGIGIGMRNAKRTADAHAALLEYECKLVSEFNVPLIEPYIRRTFDGKDKLLAEQLQKELARLKTSKDHEKIVIGNMSVYGLRIYQMKEHELVNLITKPTWKVILKVTIPAKGS